MQTTKLKAFATKARNILIAGVYNKLLTLGFKENGEAVDFPRQIQGATLFRGQQLEESFYGQWIALHEALQPNRVREVCEEVAYTWFNRLMAIQIMAKNDFIEPILSFDRDDIRVPHIVTEARAGRIPKLDSRERMRLLAVIGDASKTLEQFSILITAFCHATPLIHRCFGSINDYTELLLPNDLLDGNGFLDLLNSSKNYITDEDYHSTELLGWLYQFYISERKDEVFAKKGKYTSDDIPAATQIFTPNWIVKYMVQNAVLPQIMPENEIDRDKYKYYVPAADSESEARLVDVSDIKVADLACGSGHILIECFNTLLEPLTAELWSKTEAIRHIFSHSLLGIDIDERARQLATFALLLRACQEDNRFLFGETMPQVLVPPAVDVYTWRDAGPHFICCMQLEYPGESSNKEIDEAFNLMKDADTLGSIMKFEISDSTRQWMADAVKAYQREPKVKRVFDPVIQGFNFILALTDYYNALVMNPPYMPTNKIDVLSRYVNENYKEGKADLFTVFMQVCMDRLCKGGRMGMINMQSWMFLSSFESLRHLFLDEYLLSSMLHLGPRTFDELSGEVVQNTAFVFEKSKPNETSAGTYYRLVDGKNCTDKENIFHIGKYRYIIPQSNFNKIPGIVLGYWVSEKFINNFSLPTLSHYADSKPGMSTTNNQLFTRLWFECRITNCNFYATSQENAENSGAKWFPYNKGGGPCKWYGNNDFLVDWEMNGRRLKEYTKGASGGRMVSLEYFFLPCFTWSMITSRNPTFRYKTVGSILSNAGPAGFSAAYDKYLLGLLNTKVAKGYFDFLSPTINLTSGDVACLPVKISERDMIENKVNDCISISKSDWDAHETSWDFQANEIVDLNDTDKYIALMNGIYEGSNLMVDLAAPQFDSLQWRTEMFKVKWSNKFDRLHANEEELNRRFIEIYGLQDELTPDVPLSEVTILQQGEINRDSFQITHEIEKDPKTGELVEHITHNLDWNDDVLMKQLISYAVGCMMGRYRLDRPGLAIAHPNPSAEEITEYETPTGERWRIDDDAIIPIMPEECPFDDNASIRIAEFIGTVFGHESQIDNLNYIEQCLGKTILEYMQRDFWKDHKRIYQNRPIYWLFSSKKGAFKSLVYMHRMDPFTVGKIRNNYLLRQIEYLKQRIDDMMSRQSSLTAMERKQLKQFIADLDDCKEYDIRLHAMANQQISIDLDDGVLHNYALFGDVLSKLK